MSTVSTSTDTLHAALEDQFGLADRVVDEAALAASVERFRERGIVMPTFAQLAALTEELTVAILARQIAENGGNIPQNLLD